MASTKLRTYYRQERSKPRTFRVGFNALDAYRVAITRIRFAALENLDLVRLEVVDDFSPDLSFLDQEDFNDTRQGIALTKQTRRLATDEGVYGIVGQYRLSEDDEWEHADSCYGFIGYVDARPETNHVAPDIMDATIDAYAAAHRAELTRQRDLANGRCPTCHGTGKA